MKLTWRKDLKSGDMSLGNLTGSFTMWWMSE